MRLQSFDDYDCRGSRSPNLLYSTTGAKVFAILVIAVYGLRENSQPLERERRD